MNTPDLFLQLVTRFGNTVNLVQLKKEDNQDKMLIGY